MLELELFVGTKSARKALGHRLFGGLAPLRAPYVGYLLTQLPVFRQKVLELGKSLQIIHFTLEFAEAI
ncbi:hypothetical protein C4E44_07120 [Pseudomonas sp. MWU12-2312b]|nr:hypothetical protein C4E44_07120 [Pseudomonas sp. MWU12-2312b]